MLTYDKFSRVTSRTEKTLDGTVLYTERFVYDAAGNVTSYQYDSMSRVIRKSNAAAGVTHYTYSAAGDLLCETDALGNKKQYTYDEYGNKLSMTDPRGYVTRYTYDANNNLTSVTDPSGNTTAYTYDVLNQLISVTDALHNSVTYGYDALGRRVTVTDAKNNTVTTDYDANGNVIRVTDAKRNLVSESSYNQLNLPTYVRNGTGQRMAYTYNAIGKVATSVDTLSNKQSYAYNSRGQNTQVTGALNDVSTAEYDLLGNLTCLRGPLGGNTVYTYDALGRCVAQTTASDGTVRYAYNELNLKKELSNARGQKRQYFYDAMGRVTGYTSVEDTVNYTYDANGNVLTVSDKNGTITRTFDALNRVLTCTDTFGKCIRYSYDQVGNMICLEYSDGSAVHYEYDANKNLIRVTDWAGRKTTYTYDANNKVVGAVKPDGSKTTIVYGSGQRILSAVEKSSRGTVISGFEYTYDALSRIVEEKHLAKSRKLCYTYDKLSRVTSRTEKTLDGTVLYTERFVYDAAGNVTTDTAEGGTQYDAQNRLIVHCGRDVQYDEDGNMISDGQTGFVYDSANRLIKAGENAYTYNAEDVRIRNLCGGEETTYTYNTNCRLSHLLEKTTNGVTTKYVHGRGLIGEETNGEFKTYHFDFRGSTVAITDENSNITDTFTYDTYGKMTERTGTSPVIFGYDGRDGVVTDENGLIYMRARYYSPEMRRFINADVVAGNISNAVTLNRYAYANGNPVSNIDPFGLSADSREAIADAFKKGLDNVWDKIFGVVEFFSPKAADKINNIYKQVVTFISEVDFTYSRGIAISFSIGHTCFVLQGGISFDDDGNVALQGSWGYGLTTSNSMGGSIVQYQTLTNAPDIEKLNGAGFQIGGSITVPVEGIPITAGGDMNIIPDLARGKTYYGATTSVGFATSVGAEGHAMQTHTATAEKSEFNFFDAVKSLWNKIRGA